MRQSRLFGKTKKETIKEKASSAYKFLIKADFIERISSGIYSFLPLGWRVQKKIEGIIREEMARIGAQEVFLVSLVSKDLWQKTSRWQGIDPPLFKTKDRHQKEFGLGSTHEEVMVALAKSRITSYKDLPQALYQIQTKFRNEQRATGGLLRTREFLMKDLYSFHSSEKDFEKYFAEVAEAYNRIFKRCGLRTIKSEASGGTISGSTKTFEFQVPSPVGEDKIIYCESCSWAANKEVSSFKKGQRCPNCQKNLKEVSTIEIGHIFSLGTKYAEPFELFFTNAEGKKVLCWMGCYGIGLGRLMAVVSEVHHDKDGLCWPVETAPFRYHLVQLQTDRKLSRACEKIYLDLTKQGKEVLYDDRGEATAAEKLKDADLIGIPIRIVVSERTFGENSVEVKMRGEKESKLIKLKEIRKWLLENRK